MRKRRIILAAVVLALLVGVVAVVWKVNDWPPPRRILKYGLPPTGGPTGRTRVIDIGSVEIEFREYTPGYVRVDRHSKVCMRGDFLGRMLRPLGIPLGTAARHDHEGCRYWAESPRTFWISVAHVTDRDLHEATAAPGSKDPRTDLEIRSLSTRIPGTVRIANRTEWDYAGHTGGIETSAPGDVIGWRDASEKHFIFLLGPDDRHPLAVRGGWIHPTTYPLVWIPPEDE